MVVPSQGRQAVLQELHEGHPGMTRTKALARMYVWWPRLDSDIEQSVQQCVLCQQQQPDTMELAIQTLGVGLRMDFAGPFQGKMILTVIDSHSMD